MFIVALADGFGAPRLHADEAGTYPGVVMLFPLSILTPSAWGFYLSILEPMPMHPYNWRMFSILTIDHLVLRAHDAPSLTRFYTDVIGCRVERKVEALGLTQLRAGSALIDIVAAAGELGRANGGVPDPNGRNLDHFCLRIEPFDEAQVRSHLSEHGVQGSELRMVYGADGTGPSIYIEDPEGNTIELKGPPEKPPLNAVG